MEHESGQVYVVDDNPDVCRSISLVLNSVGYRVQSFYTAEEFLGAVDDSTPHCVIVDLLLPGMTGLMLCRNLSENSGCGFVIITGNADVPSAVDAMKMGAVDYLEKPFSRQRLLECVHEAMRLVRSRHQAHQEETDALARLAELTPRERDVLTKMAEGLPTKAIASSCAISTRTVDVHRSRISKKLQLESPVQLAHFLAVINRAHSRRPK